MSEEWPAMKRPRRVAVVALAVYLGAALDIFGGTIVAIEASRLTPDRDSLLTLPYIAAFASITIGMFLLAAASSLLQGIRRARRILTITQLISIVLSVLIAVFTPADLVFAVVSAVLSVVALVLLYSAPSNAYFASTPEQPL